MASDYAWLITRDHLDDDDTSSCAGVCGPRDASDDDLAALRGGKGRAFRMYDDDGILYVSGRILTHDDDPTASEWIMAPLDDYGAPGLGAVDIRYMINRRWTSI